MSVTVYTEAAEIEEVTPVILKDLYVFWSVSFVCRFPASFNRATSIRDSFSSDNKDYIHHFIVSCNFLCLLYRQANS